MTIRKIVVPIDYSDRSVAAARYAGEVGRFFDAEVVLVHALEPLAVDYAMQDPVRVLLEDVGEERRREAQARLDALPVSLQKSRRVVAEGEAADAILRVVKSEGAELVVMPTHGKNRIRRFLLGSVTAKVLHDCPVPVLTGVHLEHGPEFPPLQVKHVLCATDFGQQSDAVLRAGSTLAAQFSATLSAVHVIVAGEDANSAQDRLKRATADVAPSFNLHIGHGEPQDAVPARAREVQADLIVIGRGSSDDLMGRLRAQAYGIVRQAPCPVLSV